MNEETPGALGFPMLEYFAAHAPPMPEWWPEPVWPEFKPLPELKDREKLIPIEGWDPQTKGSLWSSWGDYVDDDKIPPEFLKEFQLLKAARELHTAIQQEARQKACMKHLTDWRWAYAQAMLENQPR